MTPILVAAHNNYYNCCDRRICIRIQYNSVPCIMNSIKYKRRARTTLNHELAGSETLLLTEMMSAENITRCLSDAVG